MKTISAHDRDDSRLMLFCSVPDGERVLAISKPHALPVVAKAGDPLPDEICWMPAGATEIIATLANGDPWQGTVVCDAAGFAAVQRDFTEARAKGIRVWLDENHEDSRATADIKGFRWDPAGGIMAAVQWTPFGERLLQEKQYASFSPAFYSNRQTGQVRGLVIEHASGGLTNSPAFGSAMPALIAARLAGTKPTHETADTTGKTKTDMKELLLKILAALGIKPAADATDEQLVALIAQHAKPAADQSAEFTALKAQLAELAAKAPKPEDTAALKAIQAELDALKLAAASAKAKAAKDAVQAAVARGAIAVEDKATQTKWEKIIEADATHMELLAALPGKSVEKPETVIIGDVIQAAKARGATDVEITNIGLVESLKVWAKQGNATQRQKVYTELIAPRLGGHGQGRIPFGNFLKCKKGGDLTGGAMLGPILAANSLGTLAPELILQRSLTLLKQVFPMLAYFTTDFSNEAVLLNTPIRTRTRSIPSVSTRHATLGYNTTIDATTTDVPVTIDTEPYVQMSFNVAELSSTNRDLFGEQVEGCHYAIGKDLVDAIYALITASNFTNATDVDLDDWNRNGMTRLAKRLRGRGVNRPDKFALLSQDYFEKLTQDSSLVQLAAFREPEIIHEYGLPRIAGLQPFEAVNLPTDEDLQGFAGTPDSLVIATRVPADYNTALPGGGNGSVQTVTNPDIGISVQLAMFVNHTLGAAIWRAAYMRGQAKGQVASGERLTGESS